jgi:hypothetical protein
MHNGEDEHMVRFDGIKNSVRENVGETPPNVPVKKTPSRGIFQNTLNGGLDAGNESEFQPGMAGRIVPRRFFKLLKGFRMKLEFHCPTVWRTRAKASSPGMD